MPDVTFTRHLRRKIYLIECPAGIYVGCTYRQVEQRLAEHFSDARSYPRRPLHHAMCKYPPHAFRVRVIAEAPTFEDGLATEDAIVRQFHKEGAKVLNFIAGPGMSMAEHRVLWLRWLLEDDRDAICDEYGLRAEYITKLCPFRAIVDTDRRGWRLYTACRALGVEELTRRVDAALLKRAAAREVAA